MIEHKDTLDLIELLNRHDVRFLLVGAYAVMHFTEPRYTKDVDFFIDATNENASNIISALIDFGFPKEHLKHELFATHGNFFKFGQPPWRVDFITSLKGVDFDDLYERAISQVVSGHELRIISKDDLMNVKQLAGRPQDLIDLEKLKLV